MADIAMVISIGAKMVPDCHYPNAMIDGISAGDASVDAAPLLHYTSLHSASDSHGFLGNCSSD